MALDDDFLADCPYGPEGLVLDSLLEVHVEKSMVRASMPSHPDLPITRTQRAHPVRHPQHVSGGLMVHVTGMLGFAHAYYVLGLRHRDGWIGYGGRIYSAKFLSLARMGPPLVLEAVATRVRKMNEQIFVRYNFEFRQEDRIVYRSDQSAMWTKVETD